MSGGCGDDFSPLDVTDAGGSCFRAYHVANKTWQIANACDEMRCTEDNRSLSHLLLGDGLGHTAEEQYAEETHSVEAEDLQRAAAYIAICKDAYLGIMELFRGDGHTTKSSVKLNLRGGINFDVIAGLTA